MSDPKTPTGNPVLSAEQLRMNMLKQQMAEAERAEKAREQEKAARTAFTDDFLKNHVGPEELAVINRLVNHAVNDGKMEAMVYSFPSELCTDGGRAINNGLPNWPDTLQGKARELYDRYQTIAKPEGYQLKAMIINFPGGIPGDVGFFLSWAPPATS